MNPTNTTLSRLTVGLAVVVSAGLTAACATSSQPTRTKATTPEVRSSVSTEGESEPAPKPSVEKPTPEELAASPCGNPDWAQLPPDSEINGDQDGDQKDESGSADSSETTSETMEDESNNNADR
jgi:hypothetical protein